MKRRRKPKLTASQLGVLGNNRKPVTLPPAPWDTTERLDQQANAGVKPESGGAVASSLSP